MRRVLQIVQVKMRLVQIKSRARISQNMPLLSDRKDHSHASSLARKAFHTRNVNSALRQTLHTELPERIASDTRGEPNTVTEERNIVSKDCGRAAERQHKIVCQLLSLGFKPRGKTVEDQIAVQSTKNADIKTLHRPVSLDLQSFHVNALLKTRNILPHDAAGECG